MNDDDDQFSCSVIKLTTEVTLCREGLGSIRACVGDGSRVRVCLVYLACVRAYARICVCACVCVFVCMSVCVHLCGM